MSNQLNDYISDPVLRIQRGRERAALEASHEFAVQKKIADLLAAQEADSVFKSQTDYERQVLKEAAKRVADEAAKRIIDEENQRIADSLRTA